MEMAVKNYDSEIKFLKLIYGGLNKNSDYETREVKEDQCGELVNLMNEINEENSKSKEEQFVELIFKAFKVNEIKMEAVKYRKRELVQARQLHMYVRRLFCGMSFASAAEIYGKDHATCIHAINTINNLVETDKIYRDTTKKVWQLWSDFGVDFPDDLRVDKLNLIKR